MKLTWCNYKTGAWRNSGTHCGDQVSVHFGQDFTFKVTHNQVILLWARNDVFSIASYANSNHISFMVLKADWTKLACLLQCILYFPLQAMPIPSTHSQFYIENGVKYCVNQGETDSVEIGSGVRQVCYMSPRVFNLYGEYLMKEA